MANPTQVPKPPQSVSKKTQIANQGPLAIENVSKNANDFITYARNLGAEDKAEAINNSLGAYESQWFTLYVIGKLKVGKTSLIQTILGEPNMLPSQTIDTFCRLFFPAEVKEMTRVYFKAEDKKEISISRSVVTKYTQQKDVESINIELRNDFLKNNLMIIDTPPLSTLFAEQDRLLVALRAHVFLFVLDGLMNHEEKECLKILQELIKPTIYFVQTKIDKYPEAWQAQRAHNLETISEICDIPKTEIKYFPLSLELMQYANEVPDHKEVYQKVSGFPPFLEFLGEKLHRTDDDKDRLSRGFLKKLRYETRTLQRRYEYAVEQDTKLIEWNKRFSQVTEEFNEGSAEIYSEMLDLFDLKFGSNGYRPFISEQISKLQKENNDSDIREKALELQRECGVECHRMLTEILRTYFEDMSRFMVDISERLSYSVEVDMSRPATPAFANNTLRTLNVHLRQSDIFRGTIYPLMLVNSFARNPRQGGQGSTTNVGSGGQGQESTAQALGIERTLNDGPIMSASEISANGLEGVAEAGDIAIGAGGKIAAASAAQAMGLINIGFLAAIIIISAVGAYLGRRETEKAALDKAFTDTERHLTGIVSHIEKIGARKLKELHERYVREASKGLKNAQKAIEKEIKDIISQYAKLKKGPGADKGKEIESLLESIDEKLDWERPDKLSS